MPSFEVMDDNGRNTGTERTYEAGYAYVRAPEYRKKGETMYTSKN